MQQTQDVDQKWIQAQRQRSRTTPSWACIYCIDRQIFHSANSLWDHVQSAHSSEIPSADGEDARRVFREWFESTSAQKRPSNDSNPRKPILNEANKAQPEPPPVNKRPLSTDFIAPTKTLPGIGALNISTPRGSDTMQDASEDDRQTPDLPRKRLATGDGISAGSASPFREQSPELPSRRSKGRPISAPHGGSTSEDPRRDDGFEASRPHTDRRLWIPDQIPTLSRATVDPSNIASIQAQKIRQQVQRHQPQLGKPQSPQASSLKQRSQNVSHVPQSTLPPPHQPQLTRPQRQLQEEVYDLLKQPETRPISQEQLVAEVKGIYAGLVMVEARCIEVDGKHATLAQADPKSQPKLNNEQWQALIALHRTLLHEHHDFFLASQHPSASIALRRLASKYAMPARMWRHGIHSFLELLRHRLPQSLDHMLAFIYLSYSIMALLYETVPAFEDTWIECLGDLARYRMAIEDDDIRDREVWTGVARHWYSKASDKAPTIGRLYHHLAILARPNALQQLFFYSKSLCVEIPFTSARESILTLFEPVLNAVGPAQYRLPHLDAAFVKCHGILFTGRDIEKFEPATKEFLGHLDNQIGRVTRKFMEQGYHIAVANCVAMLGFASKDNILMRTIVVSQNLSTSGLITSDQQEDSRDSMALFRHVENLSNRTFEIVLQRIGDHNVLPFIHVTLVFLLYVSASPDAMLLIADDLPWSLLSTMLNTLLGSYKTPDRIEDDSFPLPERDDVRPLPEDYAIRGLLWTVLYFPNQWFSNDKLDEDEKYREMASMTEQRKERILWLGCMIAKRGPWIKYTREKFYVPTASTEAVIKTESEPDSSTLETRTSTFASSTSIDPVERAQTWETTTESEAEKDDLSPTGFVASNKLND